MTHVGRMLYRNITVIAYEKRQLARCSNHKQLIANHFYFYNLIEIEKNSSNVSFYRMHPSKYLLFNRENYL